MIASFFEKQSGIDTFQAGVVFPPRLCSMGFLCLLQQLAFHSPGTKQINNTRDLADKVRPVTFAMHGQSPGSKVSVRTDGWLRASFPHFQNLRLQSLEITWNWNSIKVTRSKKPEWHTTYNGSIKTSYLPCRPLTRWCVWTKQRANPPKVNSPHLGSHFCCGLLFFCSLILPLVMCSDLGEHLKDKLSACLSFIEVNVT